MGLNMIWKSMKPKFVVINYSMFLNDLGGELVIGLQQAENWLRLKVCLFKEIMNQ